MIHDCNHFLCNFMVAALTQHKWMIDDSTKAVCQSNNKIPRQSGHNKKHCELGQDHPTDNPFEIWVVAKELLDLRIFFCKRNNTIGIMKLKENCLSCPYPIFPSSLRHVVRQWLTTQNQSWKHGHPFWEFLQEETREIEPENIIRTNFSSDSVQSTVVTEQRPGTTTSGACKPRVGLFARPVLASSYVAPR